MRIAIVGAGFTGLTSAIELLERGHQVVVYEVSDRPGGLAAGFRAKGWEWPLEEFYHHIFSNDREIIRLAKRIGHPAFFTRPLSASLIEGETCQLDSAGSLLTFNKLKVIDRLRMGMGVAAMKLIRNGIFLEKYRVQDALPKIMGRMAYEKIWGRLLSAKFGKYLGKVNLGWFWARIYKRTADLGYFEGGFAGLAKQMVNSITANGGVVKLGCSVDKIRKGKEKILVDDEEFDRVILTVPAPLVGKLVGENVVNWPKIDYLWGQTLVIEMTQPLMESYWLNILEKDWPFLVAAQHTNFIDRKHYAGNHILYLGNYLAADDNQLKLKQPELMEKYLPYLARINKNFKKEWIKRSWLFRSPYAQPVFPVNYSDQIPSFQTKIPGIYVANMSMVYPWDRGTNYAVEMGRRVARIAGE